MRAISFLAVLFPFLFSSAISSGCSDYLIPRLLLYEARRRKERRAGRTVSLHWQPSHSSTLTPFSTPPLFPAPSLPFQSPQLVHLRVEENSCGVLSLREA